MQPLNLLGKVISFHITIKSSAIMNGKQFVVRLKKSATKEELNDAIARAQIDFDGKIGHTFDVTFMGFSVDIPTDQAVAFEKYFKKHDHVEDIEVEREFKTQ
ncbi:hypothetical protein NEOLI_002931 [Neolecta irregularis DAH-3]|uniref:Inhibitor I9 domain-containing protein n=1 Tax=Neolecta irregularis (strain DAH-3) TaxID=1198029 RepID=A0A1U7LNB2_NEOID|nr:hypothetical protein NEOLI_002931 [Neolecta irregularis DAH-3]|eukprot:OLL24145.1 hypothetical protein NEOLI_002931 [Neolecta irregularis DAH-3]